MNVNEIVNFFSDPEQLTTVLVVIGAIVTLLAFALPMLKDDTLSKRMKSVGAERERIRARERAKMKASGASGSGGNASLRHQQFKPFMADIVEKFSLSKWLSTDDAKARLALAGYRGPSAETAFLFFRLVTPVVLLVAAVFYLGFVDDFGLSMPIQAAIALGAVYLGVKAPEIFLSNTIQKRQASMKRAYPDALDLLLICVESGMSIEHGFRKVSSEIGSQSMELAEEFALATAELSFLPDRRVAYQNLFARTGLEGIKQLVTVLVQAEKYGTPLGTALRVSAQESRDQRMVEAEKIAAALPPKLTVPMILFFLPVLLVVVIAPAMMQVFDSGY
jgi:tight adherence protein C